MNVTFNIVCLSAIVVCTARAGAQPQSVDPEVMRRVRTEGMPKWALICNTQSRDVSFDVSEAIVVVYRRPEDGQLDRREIAMEHHICFKGGHRLVELRSKGRDGSDHLERRVANDRYGFLVEQNSGRPFVLQAAVRDPEGGPPPLQGDEKSQLWYLEAGCRMWYDLTLGDALTSKDYKVLAAQSGQRADGEVIHLACHYLGPQAPGRFANSIYWADVRPDHYWLVSAAGVDIPARKAKMRAEIEYYDAGEHEIPSPHVIKRRRWSEGDPGYDETVYTLSRPTRSTCSDQEFYTPYYGISEAAVEALAPPVSSRTMLVWLGVAGVAAAGGLFWLSAKVARPARATDSK